MKKMALSLFKTENQVHKALADLTDLGFSKEQVHCFFEIGDPRPQITMAPIEENEDDRFGDQDCDLFRRIRKWGVPWEDALLFTEGVRHGGKLALVFTEEDRMDDVTVTFKKNGALDLNSRRKFAEEVRSRPDVGLTSSPFTHIVKESNYNHDFTEWLCRNREANGPRMTVAFYDFVYREITPAEYDDPYSEARPEV